MMSLSIDRIHQVLRESTLPLKPSEILSRLQRMGMYEHTPRKTAIQDINANLKTLAEQKKAVATMGANGVNEWIDWVPEPDFKPAKSAKPKPIKAPPQQRPITVIFSIPPDKAATWADSLNDLAYIHQNGILEMWKELESHIRGAMKHPETEVTQ